MKLLFHDQSFDKEMLEKFFTAVNSKEKLITIYISSDGGLVSVLESMLHIIASDPKRFIVVGYDELCSCGFEFYIRVNCQKSIIPGCIGMYHQSTNKIFLNDTGKPAYYDGEAYLKRKKKTFYPEMIKFMNDCEMTNREKKKIKKGEDVYFQYNRFKEIENAYTKNTQL